MKLMLVSDFTQIKHSLPSTALICVFIVVVMTISMGTPVAGAAAIAAMLSYIVIYSVLANDEAAGWAKLRDTLPLSRRDIVLGRFAGTLIVSIAGCVLAIVLAFAVSAVMVAFGMDSVIKEMGGMQTTMTITALSSVIGTAFSLIMLSFILPIVMRLGLTRTSRIVPIVFVLAVCLFFALGPGYLDIVPDESMLPVLCGGVIVIALVLFVISALVTSKLYEAREF